MSIINELFKGAIILSMVALIQNGCSVKDMASRAADAHKKGLSSYGKYSRSLTGAQSSRVKPSAIHYLKN